MTYAQPETQRLAWLRRSLGLLRYALFRAFAFSGIAKLIHAPLMLLIFSNMGSGYGFAHLDGSL